MPSTTAPPAYRDLFRTPEFTPFFLSSAAHMSAQTLAGLALGTLVYRTTSSPLLSALSMFGPSLAQVLGATVLLSGSDRLPPRTTLAALALTFAVTTAVVAIPGLPVWAVFVTLFAQGVVSALGGGVRWGLLNEILPNGRYVSGRSVFNMMNGLMQVSGYALGGLLLTEATPSQVLCLASLLYVTSGTVTRFALTSRPPRASGRPSVRATWRTNGELWRSRERRLTYLGLWVPNGLVVGCESLFVSYAPHGAGVLFACAALGMFVGDVTVGRFLKPAAREKAATPLLLLLAAPYVFFALEPPLFLAAAAAMLASVGFGASLVQQERLMRLTPSQLSGHALGLHSAGMLTLQGVAATLAGSLAQLTSPAMGMAGMAVVSVGVTLGLWGAGRG